ncbi:heavy metal translocating P-type ATPase [Streptococcus ovuberis]|uniref:Heavy metal translocating P-type ATPase n=1 Tax=Streptococcus ovuberis TaxID=1936207 RepID=A0A7X6MYQ2_9STRE|nr:heavy metal translocating P-type ATPase [Streptococcus ovuberis]NKZ20892.1 heavy metal translocating P-type ATPase [Streptococcus ovuberis]
MQHYFKKNRQAQFLMLGTLFLIVGLVVQKMAEAVALIFLCLSLFFLSYFATLKACQLTLSEKKLNVDLLMILSALGAVVIGEMVEAALLLLIFSSAEVLENYVTAKSTDNLTQLLTLVPITAKRFREDGQLEEVPTSQIAIGERILVAKGEQFSLDGRCLQETSVSETALTGEAIPVDKAVGDEVFAGTINLGHPVQIQVTKTSDQTVFSKIIQLVEEAKDQPSSLETGVERFEIYFVPAVLLSVPLFIAGLIGIQGLALQEAFYRGMILLTVASPCALVASVTPASLSAISHAARLGVLVKGGRVMSLLADLEVIFTDKTGTLTQGHFEVIDYQIPSDVLPLVWGMASQSQHPISQAIAKQLDQDGVFLSSPLKGVEELAGQGLRYNNLSLVKASLLEDLADPKQYLKKAAEKTTSVFLANQHQVLGYFSLADQLRPEAISAVRGFQQEGIELQMLTGDQDKVAATVAKDLGIKHYRSNCLPQDKVTQVRNASQTQVVAMIGDGINDAPALAHATIGVAMGSGAPVAMETADMVMVKNHLGKLLEVYRISRRLQQIITQNIIFAVGVMVVLVSLNLMGLLDLTQGVLFHECSTILVVLNGLRLLAHPSGQTVEILVK